MKSMNCRSVRREIEEADPGDLLSSVANDHIRNCRECETFVHQHLKLQEIVGSLGTVEAPGDFEFRLRARLAGEKRGGAKPFLFRNFSFGFRSAAFATILLLIGSTLLFVSMRSPSNGPRAVNQPTGATNKTNLTADNKQNGGQQISTPAPDVRFSSIGQHSNRDRGKPRLATVASVSETGGLKTRDLSSTSAVVVKPSDQLAEANTTYAFPIEADYHSLKVSLDDGRGSSRTISLPSVSFGSQRVLAQSSSPLLESARGSW